MTKLIVGIDFGTSTTVVRYRMEGSDEILPVRDGNGVDVYSPSVIFRSSEGRPAEYGHQALSASSNDKEGELITNFKMGLISADPFVKKQKEREIEEFLKYIHDCFCKEIRGQQYDGMDVHISYPAKWDTGMANFMKSAVLKAGFQGTVEGITEPEAATRQMLYQNIQMLVDNGLDLSKSLNVFLLDMGAGTSDVAVFRLLVKRKENGHYEMNIDNLRFYPTVDDQFLCGGREIDQKLMKHINDFCKKEIGFSEIFSEEDAKRWKDKNASRILGNGGSLGLPTEAIKPIKILIGNNPDKYNATIKKFSLTQGAFEYLTQDTWNALNNIITTAITKYHDEYKVGAENIDLLLLTGGHSQWYTVPNLFNGHGVNGNIGVNGLCFKKLAEQPWRILAAGEAYMDCVAAGCMRHNDIQIESTLANNVWLKVKVGDKATGFIDIAKIGDVLPTREVKTSPRFSLNRGALERSVFDVAIEVYTGKTKEQAKKSIIHAVVDNDSGRWLVNILFPILAIRYGYNTTIEIPMTLRVNRDNTLDIKGYYLYGDGEDEKTECLKKLKKDGKIVEITSANLKYE